MQVEVNYLAVLIAAVLTMPLGFLWYGPLFGKPWAKLMGLTKGSMGKESMTQTYAMSFVGALVMAYVLSHVMTLSQSFFGYPMLQTGLTTGFWMWLGFVAPVQLTEVLFGGKQFKLYAINTGYQLASLLVMGAALALLA